MVTTSPPWPRRHPRLTISVFGIVLLFVLLRLFALTPWASSIAEQQIEALSLRGQQIEVDGLRGDMLGTMHFDSLRVTDETGLWLDVQGGDIRWSPLRLITGHASLQEIRIVRTEYSRRPLLTQTVDQPTGRENSWLKRVSIGALTIDTLRASEHVAETSREFRLSLSGDFSRSTAMAKVDLVPWQAGGDALTGEFAWEREGPLNGTLQASGVPGGLFVSLLGGPVDRHLNIRLDATSDSTGWRLFGTGTLGDDNWLDLRGGGDDSLWLGRLELDLGAFSTLSAIYARLGGRLNLEGQLDRRSSSMPVSLAATTPTHQLTATALYSEESQARYIDELSLSFTSDDLPRLTNRDDLSLEELSVIGGLILRDGRIAFEGDIGLDSPSVSGIAADAVSATGTIIQEGGALDVVLDVVIRKPDGLPTAIGLLPNASINGQIDAEFDLNRGDAELSDLIFTSGRDRVTAHGFIQNQSIRTLSGDISLVARESRPGGLSGNWRLIGDPRGPFDATFEGQMTPTGLPSQVRQLLGEVVELSIDLERQAASSELVLQGQARSNGVFLTANASQDAGRISAKADVQVAPFRVTDIYVAGLTGALALDGSIDAYTWQLDAESPEIIAAGQAFANFVLQATGSERLGHGIETRVSARAKDISLSSDFLFSDTGSAWSISDLRSGIEDLIIVGSARIPKTEIADSEISLRLDGPLPMGGDLVASFDLEDGFISGELAATNVQTNTTAIDRAEFAVSGTWPRFQAEGSLTAQNPLASDIGRVELTPTLNFNAAQRTGQLSLVGALGKWPMRTESPLEFAFLEGLQAQGAIEMFGGRIAVQLDRGLDGDNMALQAAIEHIDIEGLSAIAGGPELYGQFTGAFELGLTDEGTRGSGAWTISDLSGQQSALVPLASNGRAILTPSRLDLVADVQDVEGNLSFDLEAKFPLQDQTPFTMNPEGDAQLRVHGEGKLASVWALMNQPDRRADGDIRLSVGGEGRLSDLALDGTFSLTDGEFEDAVSGLYLQEILLRADVSAANIVVSELRARGANGGDIEGAGRFNWQGLGDIALNLRGLDAFTRPDLSAIASGELTLTRDGNGSELSGGLAIERAIIDLNALPGRRYQTLSVMFDDVDDTTQNRPSTEDGLSINVRLGAERRLFVQNQQIESEWSLDGNVSGTIASPVLTGDAQLVRGDIDLLGKSFALDSGNLQFNGPISATLLDIAASHQVDGVQATIRVSGSIESPSILLESMPSLPEDEILSRVLFGRSPSQLSPLQTAQLAGALATFASGGTGNILAPLQSAIGVDRLNIGLSDAGGAEVSTGKYIADDVYLEVRSGLSGAPGVALQWTPRDNVEVDASLDPESGERLAIQWTRDFDTLTGQDDEN